MKKLFCIVAAVLCLLLLVSCGAREAAVEIIDDIRREITGEPEVWVTEPALPAFESLEQFIEYAETADESEYDYERIKLGELEKIILPSSMPEDYELYFIQAGSDHIALWYLPEDCLSDIRVSEMRNLNFYFEYHREGKLKSILKEANVKKSDLIDGKYLYWKNDYERRIFWEDHGSLLSMSLPGNMTVEDGNVVSTFNSEETVVSSLDELCRTEIIKIDISK